MTVGTRHRIHARRILATIALALPVLFSGLALPAPVANAEGLQDQIAASQARQEELRRAIERQRDQLEQLEEDEGLAQAAIQSSSDALDGINVDQAALREEISAATDALRRVEVRRDSLVADLRQLDWTLQLLESEIAQGAEDLEARKRLLGQRIADAYRTGQTSLLEQILDSGSFADVLTGVDAYLRFGDQDAELARSIEDDQIALDSLRRLTVATRYNTDQLRVQTLEAERQLVEQQDRLQVARDRLAALEAETRRLQQEQQQEHSRINQTQAEAAAALEEHLQAHEDLDAEIRELIAEAQRRAAERERQRLLAAQRAERAQNSGGGTTTGGGNGLMAWPVSGTVTQEYGCTGFSWEPPYGNCPHFHRGIDIANASGTLVRAPAAGVVAYSGWMSDGAYVVVLGHAGGLESWYVHLLGRRAVRPGQHVNRGQVIGYMGNTGMSTGTHLHWEVLRHGAPVNPRAYL
jgi:murein DD-endopeptidase MepM/ murein hydrolase activator NlpD